MTKAKIEKVARTTYDGFILVKRVGDEMVYGYEGLALCPKDVQKYVDTHEIKEIDACYMEAVSYGYFG